MYQNNSAGFQVYLETPRFLRGAIFLAIPLSLYGGIYTTLSNH
jgi:hypothetical protein